MNDFDYNNMDADFLVKQWTVRDISCCGIDLFELKHPDLSTWNVDFLRQSRIKQIC